MARLQVKVKPNAKQQQVTEAEDGSLTIRLQSPPTDGKANKELIALLSKRYGVPKSKITIKSGLTSRHKSIDLPD